MRTPHFVILLSVLILIAQPDLVTAQDFSSATLSAAQRANYAQAVQSFRAQRNCDAYGRFAQLADAGHIPSAQLPLVLYRNGFMLFDSNWSAAPSQQRRWNALVNNNMGDGFVSDDRND